MLLGQFELFILSLENHDMVTWSHCIKNLFCQIFFNMHLHLIFYLIFDIRPFTVLPFSVRLSRARTLTGRHIGLECTKEPEVRVNGGGGREARKIEELSCPRKLSPTP